MKPIPLGGLFVLLGLLAAPVAQAQLVPMSRCHSAFPCSIPFSIQSRPDPLVAGPYGGVGSGGMLVTVPIALPLRPRIEKSRSPDIGQALDADIHRALSHAPAKTIDEDADESRPVQPDKLTPPTPPDQPPSRPQPEREK